MLLCKHFGFQLLDRHYKKGPTTRSPRLTLFGQPKTGPGVLVGQSSIHFEYRKCLIGRGKCHNGNSRVNKGPITMCIVSYSMEGCYVFSSIRSYLA